MLRELQVWLAFCRRLLLRVWLQSTMRGSLTLLLGWAAILRAQRGELDGDSAGQISTGTTSLSYFDSPYPYDCNAKAFLGDNTYCGFCKALTRSVKRFPTCKDFCESNGFRCQSAWDDAADKCGVVNDFDNCHTDFRDRGDNDMICKCTAWLIPVDLCGAYKWNNSHLSDVKEPRTKWCDSCKVMTSSARVHKTCRSFCEDQGGLECVGAWKTVTSNCVPSGKQQNCKYDFSELGDEMICECVPPMQPLSMLAQQTRQGSAPSKQQNLLVSLAVSLATVLMLAALRHYVRRRRDEAALFKAGLSSRVVLRPLTTQPDGSKDKVAFSYSPGGTRVKREREAGYGPSPRLPPPPQKTKAPYELPPPPKETNAPHELPPPPKETKEPNELPPPPQEGDNFFDKYMHEQMEKELEDLVIQQQHEESPARAGLSEISGDLYNTPMVFPTFQTTPSMFSPPSAHLASRASGGPGMPDHTIPNSRNSTIQQSRAKPTAADSVEGEGEDDHDDEDDDVAPPPPGELPPDYSEDEDDEEEAPPPPPAS
eukprot:g40571.t1